MKYTHLHLEKTFHNKKIYNHIDEIWSIDLADFSDCKSSNNKEIKDLDMFSL